MVRIPSKVQAVKAVGLALIVSTSAYGACMAAVATVDKVSQELDRYAVNRVVAKHLISESARTVTVQVPVITQANAEDLLKAAAR